MLYLGPLVANGNASAAEWQQYQDYLAAFQITAIQHYDRVTFLMPAKVEVEYMGRKFESIVGMWYQNPDGTGQDNWPNTQIPGTAGNLVDAVSRFHLLTFDFLTDDRRCFASDNMLRHNDEDHNYYNANQNLGIYDTMSVARDFRTWVGEDYVDSKYISDVRERQGTDYEDSSLLWWYGMSESVDGGANQQVLGDSYEGNDTYTFTWTRNQDDAMYAELVAKLGAMQRHDGTYGEVGQHTWASFAITLGVIFESPLYIRARHELFERLFTEPKLVGALGNAGAGLSPTTNPFVYLWRQRYKYLNEAVDRLNERGWMIGGAPYSGNPGGVMIVHSNNRAVIDFLSPSFAGPASRGRDLTSGAGRPSRTSSRG